ncbi:twin-arginine translocation signal domain-containing protein [Cytobacillus kochii]|uniref:twin-arginine translocation signal domain-containing protein n=1 Tax=Cytobacillus kochii TaxID=859143 RepID=UPI002785B233|nr:twin-arginine translocation signal domain-containing protein [Cytobacillus kochii]MDQ0186649.1 hypothetical protein [Cytobacillus kochii]
MPNKNVDRRKFLKYLGAGAVTITIANLPSFKAFADETNPPPIDDGSLPLDPNDWNDVLLPEEAELPQDPNILLVDIDSL